MKLYHSPASPFVRKVMVVLHETGQLDAVQLQDTTLIPMAPPADLAASNPLSKIPALERPDGPTIYDSRVICAYLDDRARAGLYPGGAARWSTLTLEATADGIMEAAVLMTYEARVRPEEKRSAEWVEAQWSKAARAIAAIEARWMSHLQGPLDIGHIAVACALGYVDFRHGVRDWRTENPALADWFALFESRPAMVATRPPAA